MCHPAAATVTAWALVVMAGAAGAVPYSLPSCPRSCSCPQPSELHCTFRSLHSVPAGISKQVERINLGFNAIHTLTETSLAGLRQLELLMIHGNNIHELPHGAFTDLNALQMLKMSYNKLVELDRDTLHGLWSLARLHLDHNRLEFIHPDAFQGLTALRLLQLEGNRLQRLHPATFCTFSLAGGHLHASTLRHLHLSDNALTTLEPALLASMPRLENLYLHGNPWTCDCRMRWFHHWDSALSPDVLKCKKDRAYPGGELCALCSSPRHLRSKELQAAPEQSMTCSGPVIARSSPSPRQRPPPPLADDTEVLWTTEEFREPLGNVSLGLSDEHGNQVDLACAVREPREELARVDSWEQVDAASTGRLSANASLSAELDCPVDRDSYELLWRLIAYYSDVPAHLKRDDADGGGGAPLRSSYTYRQDAERDALYYTGVRVTVAGVAPPAWLMQPSVDLQLDRPRSTGKSARLVLRTHLLSQTVHAEMARRQRRSWVAIESTNATNARTAWSVVAGGASRMDCRVRSSEPADIRWTLPDGTQLQAPSGGPDDRLSVSADGTLAISPAGHADAGVYYCVAAVHGDLSVLPFRLAVEESSSPPPGGDDEESSPPPPPPRHVQGFVGEPVALPCAASGSPDAHIDWILPGGAIVSFGGANTSSSSSSSSSSRAVVFSNGTLRIARAQPSDGGYYKCVAVNQHGVDALATRVALSRRAGAGTAARPLRTFPARPQSAAGVNTKVKVPPALDAEEEASGDEGGTSREGEGGRRRGGSQNAGGGGGGGRGGHPSRTMWRRPAAPRRPAAAAPNANDRRNVVVETRRRINNKIDPAKWADILAKIRDKTAQSNATERRTEGVTGRRAPSSTSANAEGSSEVDATAPPATTERGRDEAGGASRAAPATPTDPDARRPHGRTHASRGRQPAQRVRLTADVRRKTADAARDTAPDRSTSASPLSTSVPQRAVTDWQARVFSTSSSSGAVHDSSVRQRLRDVTTADAVATTTADSSRTSERSESSVSGSSGPREAPVLPRGSRLKPPPTTDEPPATEERQDETALAPRPRAEPLSSSSSTTLSPTTMPARRPSGKKKGSRGRGPTRPRTPGSGRRGGRRKQRPDGRRQRPDGRKKRPGRFTTATPAEAPLATAPMRLKIEAWGKAPSAAANGNSAVPFTGGQATSPGPLSHKDSTVSGHDDNRPAATPSPPPPPPASLPLTKHSLLPPAKPPPLRSTSVAPLFFPTTSPGERGRGEVAPGASAESEIVGTSLQGVSTPAARRRFTSAPLPPVKPLEETQRGSVPGDLGPAPRSDESAPVRVQPDVVQSHAPTEAAETVPFKEVNVRLFPSAAPSVQREINRPSSTNSESDWITTTTTAAAAAAAAAGGIYKEDALETTKRPVVSQSTRPRSGEERTALVPSDGDNPFKGAAPASVDPARDFMSTTPAATAKSSPPLPSERRTPHATVPDDTTPAGGRTGSVTVITREGPKFNQIPDSHRERAQRPEQRTPLSPGGGDPLVVISSRPEPDRARASFPATHSDGQNVVVFRSTTKPSTPRPTVTTTTQAAKQTAPVHRSHTDTARSTTPARTDQSRLAPPAPGVSSGHHHLPSSRGRPRITTVSGRTVTVAAEADAQLPCEAVGEPMPFLSWTKVSTGASVAQNTRVQRFEVHPNGTLVIRAAQPADRGQYLCTVQNQHGSDKALATLAVLSQHPRVLQPRHRDASVPLGGAVSLECAVAGHPAPRVTWVLPDRVHLSSVSPPVMPPPHQRVALFNNGTLRITQASYADRGVYKCIGSSPAGADTASVRLHVTLPPPPPPVIQQAERANATLPEGGAAYLHCSTARGGTPERPVAVRWTTPDGLQLAPSQFAGGGRHSVLVFPNGTLYVRGLTAASAGRYECTASSALASSRRVVTLTVVRGLVSAPSVPVFSSTKARIVSSSPQRTDVMYGGTVQLDCLATGQPEPRIIWRTPSKKLVDSQYSFDPRIKVFANGTLTVRAATDADGGDYLCVARNKMGDDYVLLRAAVLTRAAKIERKRPQFPGQEVAHGGDLKVDCVASGLPDPEISWALPDGTMVNPAKQEVAAERHGRSRRYVVFDNGTLYFNEVGMREEGDYTCYAQNQLGKDEMKVRVRVKAAATPPRIRDKSPRVVRVAYGEAATLSCSAEGEPAPAVSWTSPTNRAIPPASDKYQVLPGGTLVVHRAQRFDRGNYTCSARNAAGTDRRVVAVEVLVTPPTIGGARGSSGADGGVLRVSAVRDRRLTVDCGATGSPVPRLMWVLPENVILPAPYYGGRMTVHRNGTLDIRAPKLTDSGRLACVARNEGGEARLTVHLDVREEEEERPPPVRGPPPAATADVATQPLTVGNAMTLNCSFKDGSAARHVTWLLPNGTPLLSGARLSKFFHRPSDGALVIGNPSAAESGVYRCLGRGATGLLERQVTLTPGRKPHISNRYNSPVSVLTGEDLLLHCAYGGGGAEPLRLSWTLPSGVVLGRPQRAGRYAVLPNGTLSVRQASVYDRGSYTCRAANEHGGALLSVAVAVLAFPPRITGGPWPAVTYARRGVAVQLNCAATGTPRPEVAWETPDRQRLAAAGQQPRLFGNKYLHPRGSLVIQNPTQRDAGVYRCTARNAVGVDSKSTYLNVF